MSQNKRLTRQVGMTDERIQALEELKEARAGGKSRIDQILEKNQNYSTDPANDPNALFGNKFDRNFIVDDNNNPIDYADEEEDFYQTEDKEIKRGPMDHLIANMQKGPTRKKAPVGVDADTVKEKQGTITNMLNELDDDDDDVVEDPNNIYAQNFNQVSYKPQFNPKNEEQYVPINNNKGSDDIEMVDATLPKPKSQVPSIPQRQVKPIQPSIDGTPSSMKRKREDFHQNGKLVQRTPIPIKTNNSTNQQATPIPSRTAIPERTPIRTQEKPTQAPGSNISIRQATTDILPTNKDGSIYIYWYDAIEDNILLKPCVIFFGKVFSPAKGTYFSISLVVKSIMRKVFILPKPEYEENIGKVYEEFENLRKTKFSYLKEFYCKDVQRNYCFELPIDHNKPHKVLKAKYNSEYGTIPANLTGETFDYIFGKNTSLLETIIISRKIKGPCWLRVKNFEYGNNFSNTWTKFEIIIKDYKNIEVLKDAKMPIPPMKILSLSTMSIPGQNNVNEVFCIACSLKDDYHVEDEKGLNKVNEHTPLVFVRKIDGKLPVMSSRVNAPIPSIEFSQMKDFFGPNNLLVSSNENALISQFINRLYQYDPDIIVGHHLTDIHLELITNRINKLKTANWSRISHFKREALPRYLSTTVSSEYARLCTAGRLICDTFVSTREILLRETNYDLRYLCKKHLNIDIQELNAETVLSSFTSLNEIQNLLQVCLDEAFYSMVLMNSYNILPLTKQLTSISGGLWSKSLQGSRAARNEMLLCHEFHDKKYLLPDKYFKGASLEEENSDIDDDDDDEEDGKRRGRRRKPQYSGGLVLEPHPGLYDQIILLLDFNSLYPSIIQEFNICFTTVSRQPTQSFISVQQNKAEKKKRKKGEKKEPKEAKESKEEAPKEEIPEEENSADGEQQVDLREKIKDIGEKAILPSILEFLVKSRRAVKNQEKNEKDKYKKELLEIKQKALKVSANSLYGYLGYQNSRFYSKEIAALITSTGRKILKNAACIVEKKHGLSVIYGDTDSVMINTMKVDIREAVEIGIKLKHSINDQYKLLEMDIDGLFKSLLLLRKKKYASLKYEPPYNENSKVVREIKGLDLVRRDWSDLGKNTGTRVLDCILSGKQKDEIITDIYELLRNVSEMIEQDKIPLWDYTITKQIAKNLDDYGDLKALPHVKVAKRLREKGDKNIKVNSYIPYVVCLGTDGDNSKSISDRSYHPKEIEADPSLKIDKDWYKENQILSITKRLIQHIPEITMGQLCECLGIKSKQYLTRNEEENEAVGANSEEKPTEILEVREGIQIKCLKCNQIRRIRKIVTREKALQEMMQCKGCNSTTENSKRIANILLHHMKKYISFYYRRRKTCVKCKDNSNVFFIRDKCPDISCKGLLHVDYSEKAIAEEISFIHKLVVNQEGKSSKIKIEKELKAIEPLVQNIYTNIKFNQIELSDIFSFFANKK